MRWSDINLFVFKFFFLFVPGSKTVNFLVSIYLMGFFAVNHFVVPFRDLLDDFWDIFSLVKFKDSVKSILHKNRKQFFLYFSVCEHCWVGVDFQKVRLKIITDYDITS